MVTQGDQTDTRTDAQMHGRMDERTVA